MNRAAIYLFTLLAVVLVASVVFGAEPAPAEPPIDIETPAVSADSPLDDLQQVGLSRKDVLRLHAAGLLKEGITVADIVAAMTPMEIAGPTEVGAWEPVFLRIDGVPEGAKSQFLLADELIVGSPPICKGNAQFYTKVAGSYTVKALVVSVVDWDAQEYRIEVLSKTITVSGAGPDPDPETDYHKAALSWLASVPVSARTAIASKNPVTGEILTRQGAVSATFEQVGKVAKQLGSIAAVNRMLTTGIDVAFGPVDQEWRSFATSADAALAALEAKGVTATEYGAVLTTIGRALR
jgi:hypothetical protein